MTQNDLIRKTGEEYHTLQRIEARLREALAVDAARTDWLRQAGEACEHLRAHLVKLFALEESQGCHPAIERMRPDKSREVKHFHDEHRVLMAKADEIILTLRASRLDDRKVADTLRRQMTNLLNLLRHHEANESQLVQLVFSQDVSVND